MLGKVSESYSAGEALADTVANQLPELKATLPALYRHSRTYYDGLGLGQLTNGFVTKTDSWMDRKVSDEGVIVDDGRWIVGGESFYDHHGNVVMTKDTYGIRRGYQLDEDFLLTNAAFLELDADTFFCRKAEYDSQWRQVNLGTGGAMGTGEITVEGLKISIAARTPAHTGIIVTMNLGV